jgi:hypothetical protein
MSVHNPYQPPSVDTTSPLSPPPQQPLHQELMFPFLDNSTRAQVAIVFLAIVGATELFGALLAAYVWMNLASFAEVARMISTIDDIRRVVYLASWLGAIISFCMWFYRAYGNVRGLGMPTSHGQAMAPGGFFIPFANLYFPYAIAKEIWQSTPPADKSRWSTSPVGFWWGTYLTGNIGTIATRMRPETIGAVHAALAMHAVSCDIGRHRLFGDTDDSRHSMAPKHPPRRDQSIAALNLVSFPSLDTSACTASSVGLRPLRALLSARSGSVAPAAK